MITYQQVRDNRSQRKDIELQLSLLAVKNFNSVTQESRFDPEDIDINPDLADWNYYLKELTRKNPWFIKAFQNAGWDTVYLPRSGSNSHCTNKAILSLTEAKEPKITVLASV